MAPLYLQKYHIWIVISLKYDLADHIQAVSFVKMQVSRKAGFERAVSENNEEIIKIVVMGK